MAYGTTMGFLTAFLVGPDGHIAGSRKEAIGAGWDQESAYYGQIVTTFEGD